MRDALAAVVLAAVLATATVAGAAGQPMVERHSPSDGAPFIGPAGASATLVFYVDYQCPVCRRAAAALDVLVADFAGGLRVEVRHLPLAMHRNAFDAAAAARAAQRQGKFWEYHRALLEAGRFDRGTLVGLAAAVGLDRAVFLRALDDPDLRRQIAAEAEAAQTLGVRGTPGFLINGHVETGWASPAYLEQVIRAHTPGA